MMSSLLIPRPYQVEAAAAFDAAIWTQPGPALLVAPVASGKTVILDMVAVMAIDRGCEQVTVCSRSQHVAEQSLETLEAYRPDISGGFYTGKKKQVAQILFATAPTLARHIEVVEAADLLLIDEADQAYVRETTKEYAAILKAARRYAGCTGTPFVLENGRTVPIFGGRAAA
jgi:superfamily II DNA or RNA helicase